MNYKRVVLKDGAVEYKIEGGFQAFFWNRLRKQVDADIEEGKTSYFIFDLAKTSKIDSMAISILVLTGKYNTSKGMKLTVKNAPEYIREIIKSAELSFIEFK